jgi:putative ABC transport system ATP-binding protein
MSAIGRDDIRPTARARQRKALAHNPRVPPLFELRDVTLSRAGEVVLRGVTADIPAGAACIAGPSGSGKSSLLRLLDRLRDPDSGEVRYRGQDVRTHDVLALRRAVSLVPQLPALIEGTVADNIEFAARLAGRTPDLAAVLEHAGLDRSFADRDAERLSVGEQQRVMLARSLAQEPDVLLLDEPTSALDEASRTSVEQTLLRLRRDLGQSYVLVTHDPEQARRMSDWCLSLALGGTVVS